MLSVEEGEVAPIETATPMEDVAPAPSASATKAVATDGEEFDPENLDASYGRPEALRGGLTRTLKQVLEECTFETVAPNFPWLSMRAPDALKAKIDEVRESVRVKTMEEFNKIVESRDLIRKLKEMDDMVENAYKRQQAGSATVGSISPAAAVRASVVPLKRAEIQRLKAQLSEMESANAAMITDIEQGEQYITETRQELDSIQTQMKEVAEVLAMVDARQMQTLIEELTGTAS